NIDDSYKKKEIKSWGHYLTYWKIHGIPYSVWEKGEKDYDYNIGFSSEEEYKFALTFYAKDGSLFQIDNKSSFLPWKDRFVSYPKN
ncbi:hypothetical protein, partial [Flavobacterium sp. FlaQc-30]|uniref:hypothetical protein n=1 Tax=Flavobacterium sp. FlaQc-30 TaxID=3374179 RepID=UPI003758201D